MSALDTQVGGGHYKGMKIQPMEYSMVNGLDACQHTAIKYISRFRDKGGIQDLEKAKHCIDMLIEFEQLKAETESPVDDKSHPRFIAGYEAGLFDKNLNEPEADPYGPRDAEGWYTWNGNETMRPAGRVRIKLRNGHVGSEHADVCDWVHRNLGLDIVQWKPEEFGGEPKRPAQ